MAEGNRQAKLDLLLEWENERDELNRLIARLRKDLGLSSSEVVHPDPKKPEFQGVTQQNVADLVQPGDFFGMTQIAATKTFLQRTKQPTALKDIATALHRGKATDTLLSGPALRNLSSVFSRSEELISVAKGRWGLTEWYPGKAKKMRSKENETGDTQDVGGKSTEGVTQPIKSE